MHLQVQVIVLEVLLHLLPIDVVDVLVHDGQNTPPFLVAVSKVAVGCVEYAVYEGEIVLDLLVALHVKPVLGLRDTGLEVGHFDLRV